MARRTIVSSNQVLPRDATATIVGDPPQWSDDLDTTYARLLTTTDSSGSLSGRTNATLLMDPVTLPLPLTVSVSLRIAGEETDTPWPTVEVRRQFSPTELCVASTGMTGEVPMTPTWVDFPMAETGGGFADLVTWLSAEDAELVVWSGFKFGGGTGVEQQRHVRVYEAAIVLDGLPGYAPPARLFPRPDGLGVGSGRHFPPSKSQQRSGRWFGYY